MYPVFAFFNILYIISTIVNTFRENICISIIHPIIDIVLMLMKLPFYIHVNKKTFFVNESVFICLEIYKMRPIALKVVPAEQFLETDV